MRADVFLPNHPSIGGLAEKRERVRPGDIVLTYSVGTVSSAGAAVMRWGDVGLGPL